MSQGRDKERFVPPIMQAFRAAFRQRDAGKIIDVKNEAGERVIPGRRSSPRSSVDESVLRQELADDISSLLNTVNLAAAVNIKPYDRVQRSILNYGIRDLTAVASEEGVADEIARNLHGVLLQYESRLVPGSLSIRKERISSDDASGLIRLHITAEMFSTPVDLAVEFIADIEPATGKAKLSRG
jgi:type VI secretion system protein ImpF